MNLPGFTAEQGLRQRHRRDPFLLRPTDWPAAHQGGVRPQLGPIDGVRHAVRCFVFKDQCEKGSCVNYRNERCDNPLWYLYR